MKYPDEESGVYHLTDDQVTSVRQVFGLTESSMRDGVDSLMEWFKKQPHLAHIDISRRILEMMLIIGKGSIERSKEKIDNFYKWRFLAPEMINNRKETLCGSNKVYDMYYIIALPKLQDNRRVHIVKFLPDLSKFDLTEFFRRVILILDYRLVYDYMAGDIWILDFKNVRWTQILNQNPLVLRKMAQFFTRCLNWRIYGIYCINLQYHANIIQQIVNFFKPYITSVIMDRIVMYNDTEGMFQYLNKECLPEDYGGNELSLEKLAEITENEYRKPQIREYLLQSMEIMSNESLRPRDEYSDDLLVGSFRKLEVD